jgi:hypothetical protein
MEELIRQGLRARKDWDAYHTTSAEEPPRYHNRPDCEDGSQINEEDVRAGTDGRPLCDKCRNAQTRSS